MIWHIAKKEIYHNLTTLRFVLMIILLPILMIANALIYGFGDNGYTAEIRDYNRKVDQGRSHIEKYAAQGLGELAMTGPAEIPKRPPQLKFCADGADALRLHSITIAYRINWERPEYEDLVESYSWQELWSLEYLPSNHGGDATTLIKIDWVFIGVFHEFFCYFIYFRCHRRGTRAGNTESHDVQPNSSWTGIIREILRSIFHTHHPTPDWSSHEPSYHLPVREHPL